MSITGIDNVEMQGGMPLQLLPNIPNPFHKTTAVTLHITEPGDVSVEIMDVMGRVVETDKYLSLQSGTHQFDVTLATAGTYFFTACCDGKKSTIKMVNLGEGGKSSLKYTGYMQPQNAMGPQEKSGSKGTTPNFFTPGDIMEYVGFTIVNGVEMESDHIVQEQMASQTINLSFYYDGLPCPGAATLTDYDGNTYNTVKINTQCWMKDNLRTTHTANGVSIPLGNTYSMTDPYRYAPNNNESNVSIYGYLYNWSAVIQGETPSNIIPSGVQGICPNGWHLPSYGEWSLLLNYLKNKPVYVAGGNTAFLAKSLATIWGWFSSDVDYAVGNNPSANNATGFSASPAGELCGYGLIDDDAFGRYAYFHSSTDYNENVSYIVGLLHDNPEVQRYVCNKSFALSVRCIRD